MADIELPGKDLVALLLCLLWAVLLQIGLGLDLGSSIMRMDALNSLIPMLSLLSGTDGDWQSLSWSIEYFAGTNLLGVYGILPIEILFAKLGVSTLWNLNLTFLCLHASYSFLALKGVLALSERSFSNPTNFILGFAIVLLLAYPIWLANRIDEGHLNIYLGMLCVQALFSFWLCVRSDNLSITLIVVTLFAVSHSLCNPSYQILIYAALFAAPMFLSVWRWNNKADLKTDLNALGLTLGIALLSANLAAPIFLEMLAYAFGPDSVRGATSTNLIFSFMTLSWQDLVDSAFWFTFTPQEALLGKNHEYHFGYGPWLLLAIPLLIKKHYLPVGGFILSFVLATLYAMNVGGFTESLANNFPFTGQFRVPIRALLPVLVLWSTMSLGLILRKEAADEASRTWPFVTASLTLASLAWVLPDNFTEILVWVAVALLGVRLFLPQKISKVMTNPIILLFLGALTLQSYTKYAHPQKDVDLEIYSIRHIGHLALEKHPDFLSPLVRAATNLNNTGLWLSPIGGINTLSGYAFPPRLFSEWVQLLSDRSFTSDVNVINLDARQTAMPVLQQLYNVEHGLRVDGDRVRMNQLRSTPGAFWSSSQQQYYKSLTDLKRKLNLKDRAWWRDQWVPGTNTRARLFQCKHNSQFTNILASSRFVTAELEEKSTAACPITASLTYLSNLIVYARVRDELIRVDTYPAYGSLLGFTLPANSTEVVITYEMRAKLQGLMGLLIGLIGSLGLIWYLKIRPTSR